MVLCQNSEFLLSVHSLSQLPEPIYPEFAFAGRSNVGKSSLINKLLRRKNYVKVSGRPGKTQGLNFFLIDDGFYFVDLPGYGYAKVSKSMQENWQKLITAYLDTRRSLCSVVVIMDLRHSPKIQDTQLIGWLRQKRIGYIPVYTKADKLSGNQRQKNAKILDIGHSLGESERVIFSAKSGMGVEQLRTKLSEMGGSYPQLMMDG